MNLLSTLYEVIDSRQSREQITGWCKKSEKDPEKVIEWVESEYSDTYSQLAAARWICKGFEPKVFNQALYICKQKKLDPMSQNPEELVLQNPEVKQKEGLLNPDEVFGSSVPKETDDDGNVLYTVDTPNMEECRQLINSHWGKSANPWCLLQGDGSGTLTSNARKMWEDYSAYPKKIIFRNGKLLAFSAGKYPNLREYWDRFDRSFPFVPYVGKVWEGTDGKQYEISKDGSVFATKGAVRGRLKEGYTTDITSAPTEMELDSENKVITIGRVHYPYTVLKNGRYQIKQELRGVTSYIDINPETLQEDGNYKEVSQSGRVLKTGKYKNGKEVGTWSLYNEEGDTVYIKKFDDNGKLINSTIYYGDGETIKQTTVVKDKYKYTKSFFLSGVQKTYVVSNATTDDTYYEETYSESGALTAKTWYWEDTYSQEKRVELFMRNGVRLLSKNSDNSGRIDGTVISKGADDSYSSYELFNHGQLVYAIKLRELSNTKGEDGYYERSSDEEPWRFAFGKDADFEAELKKRNLPLDMQGREVQE